MGACGFFTLFKVRLVAEYGLTDVTSISWFLDINLEWSLTNKDRLIVEVGVIHYRYVLNDSLEGEFKYTKDN